MANIENLEKKFLQQLQQTESFAIALTGEWGIGKTHFWKSFYDKNRENFAHKKYAYVSLFGIESLESLGYEIAIKSQGTSTTEKENDKNSKVKSFFTNMIQHIDIPKIESNGFALSIGQNLVSSIISNMVSETIICIDDLERKSDKLDMKDLMGFISQLKTEKNCQVIVILHQDKINEQNTEFQEYKEKVFDDVLYLTDNFPIIKEMIENNEMIDIYQEFYDKLKVKNLRFYQKVDKDFQNMMSLGHDFSYTSKEYILKNLIIIRLADMISPTIIYTDKENNNHKVKIDLDFLLKFEMYNTDDFALTHGTGMINKIHEYLNSFYHFDGLDSWGKILIENIINYTLDKSILTELLTNDKILEQKVQAEIKFKELIKEFHNLETRNNFLYNFYQSAVDVIPYKNLNDLSFCHEIISLYDKVLAENFRIEVEKHIISKLNSTKFRFDISEFYPYKKNNYDIFYHFILKNINNSNKDFDYCNFFMSEKNHSNHFVEELNKIDKDILRNVIWMKNYEHRSRRALIKSIIQNPSFTDEKKEQVLQWIIELLEEKIQENPDSKIAIQFLLNHIKQAY